MNPDMVQSVFSGICPTDTTRSRTQGSHKYCSQSQSRYGSVCILRYLSCIDTINLYPNLYLSYKKLIQDASCSLTKKQLLSHCNQSKVLTQLNFILISMLQAKLLNIITSFASLYTIA